MLADQGRSRKTMRHFPSHPSISFMDTRMSRRQPTLHSITMNLEESLLKTKKCLIMDWSQLIHNSYLFRSKK